MWRILVIVFREIIYGILINQLGIRSNNVKLILIFIEPLLFQAPMVLITISCDQVEKHHKKVLFTCYRVQSKMKDDVIRDEFIILSNFLKDLSPKITASGFYQLNQNTFSSFTSATVAYIVIILQFGGQ